MKYSIFTFTFKNSRTIRAIAENEDKAKKMVGNYTDEKPKTVELWKTV